MSIAVGYMGMSIDDFCRCTPSEFSTIYEAWQEKSQRKEQETWEQTRFLACCILQPYSKKKLMPKDVCRFSWEKQQDEPSMEIEASSKERFEEIVRLWNE